VNLNLYLTADEIGTATGGGTVTAHELAAFSRFGKAAAWSFSSEARPWGPDEAAARRLLSDESFRPRLAHVYSGTFTRTVSILKERGCRVTYTCAAHDVAISRAEHERLGLPFDYPHLTDPAQWERYAGGYRLADVVVCPSKAAARIVRAYGGCDRIVVIPHGVDLSPSRAPLPGRFAVAYLGQGGPDKGVAYLIEAWAILGYEDALLTIAGRGTEALLPIVRSAGRGSIYLRGTVDDVGEIYDACALYVQPSATEGFGIEVLEAMARGRVVICSDGAGASDALIDLFPDQVVPARAAAELARRIALFRDMYEHRRETFDARADRAVAVAGDHAWSRVCARYVDLWESLCPRTSSHASLEALP
jgi:glycosyltransferase involved in cell wall biosynthesis